MAICLAHADWHPVTEKRIRISSVHARIGRMISKILDAAIVNCMSQKNGMLEQSPADLFRSAEHYDFKSALNQM